MSYTFEVIRDLENSTTTLSTNKLINDETGEILFSGVGCSPKGPSTEQSGKNQRILPGEYTLTFTDSARNGSLKKFYPQWNSKEFFNKYPQYIFTKGYADRNVTVWIQKNKEFNNRRILIHIGNSYRDSLGCYLLGKWRNVNKMTVSDSTKAINEFYTILLKVGIENVKLIIKESFN